MVTTRDQERIALAYQRDLKRAGIEASVRAVDPVQFDQRRLGYEFDMLASPAFAQESKTVGAAPAEAKFSTVSKDEMFSSKLKGLNVYNQKEESVGEITDIAIKGNQVDALILSVGGFLGMGEHYVAVSPGSVNVKRDAKNDKWVATMNTTKEALKAAPEFKYPK